MRTIKTKKNNARKGQQAQAQALQWQAQRQPGFAAQRGAEYSCTRLTDEVYPQTLQLNVLSCELYSGPGVA